MDINITGRNLSLDESFKEHVFKKLSKLQKIYSRIYKCDVVLEESKLRKNIEIIMHLKHSRIVAKESSEDIYTSLDNAIHKIKTQLRKINGRISSKRRNDKGVLSKMMSRFWMPENADMPSREGKIIQTDSFADKPMLPEEAKLEVALMGKDFIMFKNADTGKANVLYKRNDGNYGLIEPKF